MPGLQRESRGVDPSRDRSLGELMAPREAEAKPPAASLEASFGLCYPSVPQQMAMLKALCGLENGLSFLPWVQCCVPLDRTLLFPPQTPRNFKTLSNSPGVNQGSFAGFKDFGDAGDWRRVAQPGCLSKMFETGLCFPDSM